MRIQLNNKGGDSMNTERRLKAEKHALRVELDAALEEVGFLKVEVTTLKMELEKAEQSQAPWVSVAGSALTPGREYWFVSDGDVLSGIYRCYGDETPVFEDENDEDICEVSACSHVMRFTPPQLPKAK